MEKDELIVKQQLEIEELKAEISEIKDALRVVRSHLWRPEQWNSSCPDFPKVAKNAIVRANRILLDI